MTPYIDQNSFVLYVNEYVIYQDPRRENLKLREDGSGGVFVEFLSEHVVCDTEEVMKLIQEGARLRTTSKTRMNKVMTMHTYNAYWRHPYLQIHVLY